MVLALATAGVGASAVADHYFPEQAQAETTEPTQEYTECPIWGDQQLSIDGAAPECMSQAQYTLRMLAARKPEVAAAVKTLCEAGNQFDCAELARIGKRHGN